MAFGIKDILLRLTPRYWREKRAIKDKSQVKEDFSSKILPLEYQWINNEHLLREEGAVYGLLDEGLDEKLEVIQKVFNKIIKPLEAQKNSEEEELDQLILLRQSIYIKLEDAKIHLSGFQKSTVAKAHYFWNALASLLIYGIVIGGSFYISYIWLLPELGSNTLAVSLGAFLFGALSLYSRFPFLLFNDRQTKEESKREQWKLILEEIGAPIVAVIFIVSFGAPHHPWWHSVAMVFFLLFVFLFAGKGLLTSLMAMIQEWPNLYGNISQQRDDRSVLARITQVVDAKQLELDELSEKIEEKRLSLTNTIQQLEAEKAECEARKAFFISEYMLAKMAQSRQQFSQ